MKENIFREMMNKAEEKEAKKTVGQNNPSTKKESSIPWKPLLIAGGVMFIISWSAMRS